MRSAIRAGYGGALAPSISSVSMRGDCSAQTGCTDEVEWGTEPVNSGCVNARGPIIWMSPPLFVSLCLQSANDGDRSAGNCVDAQSATFSPPSHPHWVALFVGGMMCGPRLFVNREMRPPVVRWGIPPQRWFSGERSLCRVDGSGSPLTVKSGTDLCCARYFVCLLLCVQQPAC